jgi:hypothetical protein
MAKANQPNGAGRPSQDAIGRRAYELYLQRGSVPGHELDDWLQAEAELIAAAAAEEARSSEQAGDTGRSFRPEGNEGRRPTSRERSPSRRVLRQ